MSIRFSELGLPVIDNERMVLSGSYKTYKDAHLIINAIITTLIFLNLLLIFTLFFNIGTRGWKQEDFNFFIFFIFYTLFNFIMIPILIYLKY